MRIQWTRNAITDLQSLRTYIARERPRAARRIASRILASAGQIAEHPHIGKTGRVPATREYVIADTPYVLVYRVSSDQVDILRILHAAQNYP